jgi:parallel beta-helix repeat protein
MRKASAKAYGGVVRRKGMRGGGGASAIEGLEPRTLFAVFTVTTTADAGPGTLRQAIDDSNVAVGKDSIAFAIGTGAQIISPLTALPALTDTAGTIVDGSSQPGFAAGAPVITIDGSSAGTGSNGLQIQGGLSTVLGLIVQNFDGDQLEISGGGNDAVLGCTLIGTGADPSGDGVEVGAADCRIGGPAVGDRNVIGANLSQSGVNIIGAGTGAIVENNVIGANAAGAAATPNGTGVTVLDANDVTIINNLISGNSGDGVTLTGSANNIILRGNRIGTDAPGTGDLGNGGAGIALTNTGGIGPIGDQIGDSGAPNIIAFNDGAGVSISGTGTNNAISGNSIFSNTGLGIDLGASGRTANDAGDGDSGADNLQNFPVLTQSVLDMSGGAGSITSGALSSHANTAYRIEFFSGPATGSIANGQGKTFLGATSVTTDSSGNATFDFSSAAIGNGLFVTATATDPNGNTSEFSDAAAAGQAGPDIQVLGNNVDIPNGDDTPAAADLTDFGSAVVGSGSVTRTFTVNNAGGGLLTFSGGNPVTIGGPAAAQFSVVSEPSGSLTSGSTATFQVMFSPTAAGTQEALVSIASNDSDENPFTFTITGTGTTPTPAPEIEVRGNGLSIASGDTTPRTADFTDFGTASVGTASPVTHTFVIANAGALPLTVNPITFVGAAASQFTVTSQPSTTSVAAGQQTTFTVAFSPTVGGTVTADVNIPSNDADENPYRFTLRGVALASADAAPTATLLPQGQQPVPVAGTSTFDLIVRYSDDLGLNTSSFDNGDILVTGPNNFSQAGSFLSIQSQTTTSADVVYRVTAPGGTLDAADNGNYTVNVDAAEVFDTSSNSVAPGAIGTFTLDVTNNGGNSLGQFGLINGKRVKLKFSENDGTIVTISLSNGTGEAFRTEDGRFDLNVTSNNGKLSIATKGGNGRAEMHDVRVTGSLKNLSARTGDVAGTAPVITSTSGLGAVSLGSTTGVTISTPGNITGLNVAGSVATTNVFAGANLGADGVFGGTGSDADTFAAGSINKLSVGGSITQSLIAAGLDPVDDQLLNGNGVIVGGASSLMKSIKVKGAVDNTTVFAAGAFPKKAGLGGQKVDPLTDPHFDSTP